MNSTEHNLNDNSYKDTLITDLLDENKNVQNCRCRNI